MPDEFPTLEAVALLGTLATLARTFALWSGMSQIPVLLGALEPALRTRELARARHLCERSKAAMAARFGLTLVEGLDSPDAAGTEERRVQRALSRARALVRRGHARDLVALAMLFGAGAYADLAALGVGAVFYVLLATALALTVLGAFLRQGAWSTLRDAAPPVTAALKAASAGPVDAPGGVT